MNTTSLKECMPMTTHNKIRTRVPILATAICLSSLCLSSAFADDTEVFFGQVDPSLDTLPNVLFVLDTSSSMKNTDGTGISRLERMKSALATILDNVTNVNVGVMRFSGSNGGGAVLFPVTGIDKEICDQNSCGQQSTSRRILSKNDDIEEAIEHSWSWQERTRS